MTFHEFAQGMSVMDGRRCVGRARPRSGGGIWLARLYGACWIDTMSDPDRRQRLALRGMRPNVAADLKLCRTKRQARNLLQAIARV